ncbi:MAG: hypothetical protein ACK4SY_10430 [Pyrobaculum sp.]
MSAGGPAAATAVRLMWRHPGGYSRDGATAGRWGRQKRLVCREVEITPL